MPPDCYRVEIVHYLNPHLIWVEVRDPSALKEEFLFEQIGIYGILPMEKTLDVCLIPGDLSMKSQKCDEWLPAASVAMNKLLEEAEKVWFSLTFLDGRTTIFDDNIHKYGEIILKTRGGKLIELSKQLINSGLAHIDVCEFHEKLSCGKLNTKLSTLHTLAVIKRLEEYCTRKDRSENLLKKSLEKQTSVFRLSQEFEKSLTVSNLEKHYNVTLQTTLINKLKDFELCKDVDEQPVGRACSKSKTKLSKSTAEVQKSPETEVSNQSGYSRIRKFLAKKRLESELKHEINTENKLEKNDAVEVEKLLENAKNVEKTLPDDYFKTEPKHVKSYMVNKTTDETDIYGKEKTRSEEKHFEEKSRHRYDFEGQIKSSSRFEEKISSNRHQEENIDSCKTSKSPVELAGPKSGVSTRVAYGSPGLDPKSNIEKVKTAKRDCMYGDVDSEIGLEIVKKKTLRDYLNKGNDVGNCEKTKKVDEKSVSCDSSSKVQNEQKILNNCAGIDHTDDLVEINNNETVQKDKFVESGIKMSYRDNSVEKYDKKKIRNESKVVESAAEINNSNQSVGRKPSSVTKRKLKAHRKVVKHQSNVSSSDTSNKDSSSDVI